MRELLRDSPGPSSSLSLIPLWMDSEAGALGGAGAVVLAF